MSNNNELQYDEDDAVKFIRNYIPQELKEKLSDNDINYIIDVIYDFYDEKGFMNDDISDEDIVELDEDELIEYVIKSAQKDKVNTFTHEEINFVVQGELQYCESLGMFD
ncbi:hypothetical protein D0T53_08385 [Dysgonomonas sp. 216]|uniref:hypothetical protein n=1 Tax=Dysgonomonas sp. 216 TaxID=2302934 RepID=UPI0013D0797C|nr:hypothetical protein [Dysgonomonas sp. 216]NDW18930.1 hypothetical protein [Dysgonomonas sp. 216]